MQNITHTHTHTHTHTVYLGCSLSYGILVTNISGVDEPTAIRILDPILHVCVAIGCGLEDLGIVIFPGGATHFQSSSYTHTGYCHSLGTGPFFLGKRGQVRECDLSLSHNAKVTNACSYTSILHMPLYLVLNQAEGNLYLRVSVQ